MIRSSRSLVTGLAIAVAVPLLAAGCEIKTRFELLGDAVGTVSGNASALGDIKPVCIPAVAAAGVQAAKDVTAALTASASVTAKVGG